MSIRLYDLGRTGKHIDIDKIKLLIPGSKIGASDDWCYIPIFRSNFGSYTMWHLGSIFIQKYYVIYDMTPYDNFGKNYLQVGIGLKNTTANITDVKYNNTSPIYSPGPN